MNQAILKKVENFWIIIIEHKNGSRNDYRFETKKEACRWAKTMGLKV